MNLKKVFVMFVFSAVLGAVIGGVIWGFLRLMDFGIEFLWQKLPEALGVDDSFYTLGLCVVGGVIIGLVQKKWGSCPPKLMEVMSIVKKEGTYDYHHMPQIFLAALLPLLFGAAVGPEAGLTGVLVGLCYWAGDHLKFASERLPDVAGLGISATLAVLFGSPFFGFLVPLEEDPYADREVKLPKGTKIFATFCGIFGALILFMLLGQLFGRGGGLPRFGSADPGLTDMLWLFPLVLIGVGYGWLFLFSEKLVAYLCGFFGGKRFFLAVTGGVLLGLVGMLCPYALFSGEAQMAVLIEDYGQYTPLLLFGVAAVKMVLTNICICSGWRGGHFFPAIFSGVCAGLAASMVFSLDPVFCAAVTCVAVVTTVLRKPIAAAMLLILCFPVDCLFYLIAAAFLAALIPDFSGGKRHADA